jgi:hypothetical protein
LNVLCPAISEASLKVSIALALVRVVDAWHCIINGLHVTANRSRAARPHVG